jgi:hypothetical protein
VPGTPPLRPALLALAAALLLLPLAAAPSAADTHGVPLPPGSRSLEPDLFESGRGFRQSVEHVRRFLARTGSLHEEIPVYAYRGVVVARFLAREQRSRWLAIQVYRADGRTRISIVPRPSPLTTEPTEVKDPRSTAH